MIEINSKYGKYLGNDLEPTATCISATVNEQGLIGNFVVDIDGKYLHYENNDLTEIVKDKLYETLFPNRAEKEAITNINTEIEKIKTELLANLETKINEKLEKSQTELTTLVMTLVAEATERVEEILDELKGGKKKAKAKAKAEAEKKINEALIEIINLANYKKEFIKANGNLSDEIKQEAIKEIENNKGKAIEELKSANAKDLASLLEKWKSEINNIAIKLLPTTINLPIFNINSLFSLNNNSNQQQQNNQTQQKEKTRKTKNNKLAKTGDTATNNTLAGLAIISLILILTNRRKNK